MSRILEPHERITIKRLELLADNGVQTASDALKLIEKLAEMVQKRDSYLEEVLNIYDATRKQAGC